LILNIDIISFSVNIKLIKQINMFPKFYKVFNYSTIAIVLVFLVLILTNSVSRDTYITLLVITLIIFIARIVLRVYLQSYLKKNSKGE